jgi:hypothetical protein
MPKLGIEMTILRRSVEIALLLVVFLLSVGCSRPVEVQGSVFIVTQGAGAYPLALVEVDVYAAEDFQTYLDSEMPRLKGFQDSEVERLGGMTDVLLKPLTDYEALASQRDAASKRAGKVQSLAQADALLESLNLGRKLRAQEQFIRVGLETLKAHRKLHPTRLAGFVAQQAPSPLFRVKTDAQGKFALHLEANKAYTFLAQANRTVGDNVERYAWLFSETFATSAQPPTLFLSNDNLAGIGTGPLDWATFALPETSDLERRATGVLDLAGQAER